jgi:hypothetical protein
MKYQSDSSAASLTIQKLISTLAAFFHAETNPFYKSSNTLKKSSRTCSVGKQAIGHNHISSRKNNLPGNKYAYLFS